MYDFFLRFYNQTDEQVEECVAKLKAKSTKILSHRYDNDGRSMNLGSTPSHTVKLRFLNEAMASAVMVGNDEMRDIYMQYATGSGPKGSFDQRRPGNAVWQH